MRSGVLLASCLRGTKQEDKLTGNVHWHLFDLGAVELFDLTHHAHVIGGDEVDCDTFPAESAATSDTMDVVLAICREVVVDDKGDLLHINTTGEQVSGDEHTRGAGSELLHDDIALCLVHVAVHGRDGEVASSELVGEPVDLSTGVAEDDGLGDRDGLVQIGQCIQFPLFFLDCDVELLDTFKSELIFLDENADWVAHELRGDFEDVLWHGSGKQDHLGGLREELEDVVDLLGETARQHLVGFVEDEHLHAVGPEHAALNHVLDAAGCADHHLWAILERLHIISYAGTTNTGVALDAHEIADGDDDFLDLLSKFAGGGEDQSLAGLDVGVDLL